MNIRLKIGDGFSRKAICISLILFVSIGFSFSGAQADSCRGGADCLICTEQLHRHLPGVPTNMVNLGCTSAQQKSTCGFEAGQGAEKFYGIASAVRFLQSARSANFAGAANEDDHFRLSRGLIASFFLWDPDAKAPIYLRNHSLLC